MCTVTDRGFNFSDHLQKDLFVRIEQIEDPYTPLSKARLSYVTSLCGLFRTFDFNHCQGTLSAIFYHRVSTDDVTTASTGSMTVGPQFSK